MSVALIVFRQLCMMALIIGIGFFFGRRGVITPEGNRQLSAVLTGVVIPAVIIGAFFDLEADAGSLRLLAVSLAVFFGSHLFSLLAALLLFRRKDERAAVSRALTTFTNNGFFGIPVLEALFGARGVFFASVSVMCTNLLLWTWCSAQFEPRTGSRRAALRQVLRQPPVLALAAGVAVLCLRLTPLAPALTASGWFSAVSAPFSMALTALRALNTPLAMLVLGVSIANSHGCFGRSMLHVAPFAALRQVLLPFLQLLVLMCLPVDRTLAFSVFVEAACPCAMIVTVMALRYNSPAEELARATRAVVLSTLTTLLTLPLMVALGQALMPV